jgi:hypothetical protein
VVKELQDRLNLTISMNTQLVQKKQTVINSLESKVKLLTGKLEKYSANSEVQATPREVGIDPEVCKIIKSLKKSRYM